MSDITWRDAYDTRAEYERDMQADDAYWRPLYDAYGPADPKVWESQDWDLVRDMERGK